MAVQDKELISRIGADKIRSELEKLINQIDAKTNDPDNFLSISELEKMWSELAAGTSKIYSDSISEAISNIDEKELIKAKKQS